MVRVTRWFWLILFLAAAQTALAGSGKVYKVLPVFLDKDGRFTVSPSLYDRDAYQVQLRQHPEQRSGVRYDVHWKSKGKANGPLLLRVELRGIAKGDLPRRLTLEKQVKPTRWFGTWTNVELSGEAYGDFGEVTAWRVSLWDGATLLSSRQSFLW